MRKNILLALKYFAIAMIPQGLSAILFSIDKESFLTLFPIYFLNCMLVAYYINIINGLKEEKVINWKIIALGAISVLCVMSILSLITRESGNSVLWDSKYLFYAFLPTALITGPIYEELIFRHFLINSFRRKFLGAVVSAALFAILHSSNDFTSYIFYFFEAIILTIVYKKTNNIINNIFVHSVVNLLVILANIYFNY